ncbi:hypothetical protein AVEN_82769-1 [Araneus ventricosus]|uniref:Uncharacterized protein n=1 Tax=Araneus ventricosus TaxID=182803 RepID=A0A4Y2E900_ARAVE|nr:hypothetical protein AVEN_82769-1 [Araneus ventricosus]
MASEEEVQLVEDRKACRPCHRSTTANLSSWICCKEKLLSCCFLGNSLSCQCLSDLIIVYRSMDPSQKLLILTCMITSRSLSVKLWTTLLRPSVLLSRYTRAVCEQMS